jgi:hypothetical protein
MTAQSVANWTDQVKSRLQSWEAQRDADPAEVVRQCRTLLESGPRRLCEPLTGAIAQGEIDRLLEHQAPDAAALRLLARCGYMLSSSGGGLHIASVKLPAAERDYSFSAGSVSEAICGAISTALLETLTEE